MTSLGLGPVGSADIRKHLACGTAGENYALGIASTLARASEKTNICQQSAVKRLLVGG